MDNARLIIAIGLSIIVFIVWDYFFVGKKKVQQPKQPSQAEQQVAKAPLSPGKEPAAVTLVPPQQASQRQAAQAVRVITVNTPLYSVKISEKGAGFKNLILKKYKQSIAPGAPLYEMISADMNAGTVRLGFDRKSLDGLEQAVFLTDLESDAVDILEKPREISFFWKSPQGFVIKKTFTFAPETYLIGLSVTLANGSSQTFRDSIFLSLLQPVALKGSQLGFEGPSALLNNSVEQVKTKKIKDQNVYPGKLKWLAIQDRYFISAIIPDKPDEASMRIFLKENSMLENQYLQAESVINPGSQLVFKYNLFFGPKSLSILKKIDYDLNKAVDFGMFDFLAKPLVWVMNFLYDHFIPNYGVAIIILTVITKIVLWPLGTKSYKSMAEMKKIQPLMADIREKYGSDKKKVNEAMMSLYKTYKVNPLGGCLPMVVQIPVFFALYRMLYESIELRHAPFIGWINDLSAPDRLFSFDFSIPFMQPPYGIPVLTIIMGATMLVQQKMSPPPGDPVQAKMMMLMPVVFTVIFINFSSGLVLYWLVNNILSIAQQYYVSKKAA